MYIILIQVYIHIQKVKEWYEYIENENGEIFNPTESNFESSGTIYGVAGDFKHWQTFDLTKNDATNKLIIHFKLHLQGTRNLQVTHHQ